MVCIERETVGLGQGASAAFANDSYLPQILKLKFYIYILNIYCHMR